MQSLHQSCHSGSHGGCHRGAAKRFIAIAGDDGGHNGYARCTDIDGVAKVREICLDIVLIGGCHTQGVGAIRRVILIAGGMLQVRVSSRCHHQGSQGCGIVYDAIGICALTGSAPAGIDDIRTHFRGILDLIVSVLDTGGRHIIRGAFTADDGYYGGSSHHADAVIAHGSGTSSHVGAVVVCRKVLDGVVIIAHKVPANQVIFLASAFAGILAVTA